MSSYQISQAEIRIEGDVREHLLAGPHGPAYHFVVPERLAHPLDPNGAIFWQGNVYLGYIYRRHGKHFWGHISSHDWLRWQHHGPWLFATPDSPEEGILSGSRCHEDGEAIFLIPWHQGRKQHCDGL